MDRHSWLWRRKSADKSPGDTESSGSASSHSERYSDDQEGIRASSNNASPRHVQSPEVSSHIGDSEVHETVKSLSEKLSAALLNINAKEELVRQHAKVAEEAVAGWEQAETEVTNLKQQLEASFRRNAALEDQIGQLDGTLKECVRQLHQSREEHEEKIHEVLAKNTHQRGSDKSELENRLLDLERQLEDTKSEARGKLHSVEKENMNLKAELLARSKDLEVLALERDLINQAAEAASKQHLESVKKITKVEAECRRLHTLIHRTSAANDPRPTLNSVYVESLMDSQSDSAERMLVMDNEMGYSDSWASALIAELDQFKNEKPGSRRPTSSSVEIDLMDDFLEMERLAALPEVDHGSSSVELETDSDRAIMRDLSLEAEVDALRLKLGDLQPEKMESEKGELIKSVADTQCRYEISYNQLAVAGGKLALTAAEVGKLLEVTGLERQVEAEQALKTEYKLKLVSAQLEVGKLREMLELAECEAEKERALNVELSAKLEAAEMARNGLQSEVESASLQVQKLREKSALLEAVELARKSIERRLEAADLEISELCSEVEAERALKTEYKLKLESAMAVQISLEAQLTSAQFEVGKLREMFDVSEGEVVKERALTSKLLAKLEAAEAVGNALRSEVESASQQVQKHRVMLAKLEAVELERKLIERQLETADLEVAELRCEVEAERALKTEYKMKLESAMAVQISLDAQLTSAQFKVGKLREMLKLAEGNVEKERALTAELLGKLEAAEAQRNALQSEAESSSLQVQKLGDVSARLEAVESARKTIESRLKTADLEVEELRSKARLLEGMVEEQRVLSKEFATKCRRLEAQISQDNQIANSIGELKIKQEKLAECQKTIASLGQHLKSLMDLDDLILEADGSHEGLLSANISRNLHGFDNLNTNDNGFHRSPAVKSFSAALVRFSSSSSLSWNRNNGRVET